ncbi:MAG: 4Fe-4S binding protein [Chitinivibrionales bacterium]|nr:4Fe-4S binding protein [Chitinivibrionales bacterium]
MIDNAAFTKRRKLTRILFFALLLCIPLRLIGFDIQHERFLLLGLKFSLHNIHIPMFALLGGVVLVLFLSIKKGRVFCSWLCPVHYHLEGVNSRLKGTHKKGALFIAIQSIVVSLLAVEVVISFFVGLPEQIHLVRTSGIGTALLAVGGVLFVISMSILWIFKHNFCKRACPYALFQLVLQSNDTRIMQFSDKDKRCIKCKACDRACPFDLDAREQSSGIHCTNCNLCANACEAVLGYGKGLFALHDPARMRFGRMSRAPDRTRGNQSSNQVI